MFLFMWRNSTCSWMDCWISTETPVQVKLLYLKWISLVHLINTDILAKQNNRTNKYDNVNRSYAEAAMTSTANSAIEL